MIQNRFIPKSAMFGVIVGAILVIAVASLADHSQIFSFGTPHSWFTTVHTTVNSYHIWRADPLTSILFYVPTIFGIDVFSSLQVLPIVQLLVFYCGVVLLLLSQGKSFIADSITLWLVPTLLSISMILLFGLDEVIFGSIQWIPWLTVALGGLKSTASVRDLLARLPLVIAAFFFTFLTIHSANQFALLSLLSAIFFHRLVSRDTSAQDTENFSHAPLLILRCSLVCVALYASFTVPLAQFPSFPPEALIVPDDGVSGIVRPNVGSDYSLAVINREATREITFPFISTLLLGVFAAWCYIQLIRKEAPTLLLKLSLWSGILLLLDTLLPEPITLQLPVGALQRVLPGLTYLPLHLLILAIYTYFSYLSVTSIRSIVAPCILFVALLTSKASSFGATIHALYAPAYSSEASDIIREAAYGVDSSKKAYLISPSLFVIQYFNYLFLPHGSIDSENAKAFTTLSAQPIKGTVIKVETSPPSSNSQIEHMFDGDLSTRWSPGGGVQIGGESITLYFSSPLSFDGLQVDSGEFKTDYPRGIKVSIPEKCTTTLGTMGVWYFPIWRGSLRFSPDNFAYFGPQSDVIIPFGATVTTSCLVIEQLGSDSHFDWSVAEIYRLIKE